MGAGRRKDAEFNKYAEKLQKRSFVRLGLDLPAVCGRVAYSGGPGGRERIVSWMMLSYLSQPYSFSRWISVQLWSLESAWEEK